MVNNMSAIIIRSFMYFTVCDYTRRAEGRLFNSEEKVYGKVGKIVKKLIKLGARTPISTQMLRVGSEQSNNCIHAFVIIHTKLIYLFQLKKSTKSKPPK